MKPFDLNAALAGAPVVTRDGRKILQIAHFPDADVNCRIVALITAGYAPGCFSNEGAYACLCVSEADLFMAPVKRTVWVTIYRDDDDLYACSVIFDSKHDAEETAKGDDDYIGTYPLEIEE